MSAALRYISCPVSQLDLLEHIGVRAQVDSFVIKTVVEIQGENGTALTGKQFTDADSTGTLEKAGVINNLGHSFWEQIVLFISDTKVTESSNNYAYKAMLETLLSYDDVDEKSVLRLSCFKKNHGSITAEFPTATHVLPPLPNSSRLKRKTIKLRISNMIYIFSNIL